MKNEQLIQNFLHGDTSGSGSNLQIVGDKLISYNTVIAQRRTGKLMIVNETKYSMSTTRWQNVLKNAGIAYEGTTGYVPKGTGDLEQYTDAQKEEPTNSTDEVVRKAFELQLKKAQKEIEEELQKIQKIAQEFKNSNSAYDVRYLLQNLQQRSSTLTYLEGTAHAIMLTLKSLENK